MPAGVYEREPSSEDRELDRQLAVYSGGVTKRLVLQDVFVVHEHLGVAREPVAVVMVHVELLVVVTIVTVRATPCREGAHVRLRPRVVRVVEGDSGHPRPIQVVRVECVAE